MFRSNATLVAWSGGKDSALALFKIKKLNKLAPACLLTTVTKDYARISMHGVREKLLDAQARSLGLFVDKVYIPKSCTNRDYESLMSKTLAKHRENGIKKVVFGDIFLEELKAYRVRNLKKLAMGAVFPLWKADTAKLARSFVRLGFKAVITCVDTKILNASFAGRRYDLDFLNDLPAGVDPCGENGEFHSFVYDGPIFKAPIKFKTGKRILKHRRFCFCDLVPAGAA